MEVLARGAQIGLGLLFLSSGALKLGDRLWPETASAFGLPAWVGRALPWVEVVLGALLVAGVGLPWTGLAALVALAAFTVVLAVHLAWDRRAPCRCFGGLSDAPISVRTVARNVVLLGVAVVALL